MRYDAQERQRQRADCKIARAHELVLDEWPRKRIAKLSPPIRSNPWYRPLDPRPADREFLDALHEKRAELEAQPTGHYRLTEDGPRVVAGWEAVEAE